MPVDVSLGEPRRGGPIIPPNHGQIGVGHRPQIAQTPCLQPGEEVQGLRGAHKANSEQGGFLREGAKALARETINATGESGFHCSFPNYDVDKLDGYRQRMAYFTEMVTVAYPTNSLIGSPSARICSGRWAWS